MLQSTPATDIHNEQVLDAVPDRARKILEIGTGTGALARQIARKLPGVDYVGVEISESYGQQARSFCSRVYVENFEDASAELLNELLDTDVVIFADVLEHFIDPWSTLERMRSMMRPGSYIISSMPNLQHWSIQYRLMAGDFRYADTGLLDRTHLRFFTRQTMLEMFSNTGYSIEQVVPRIFAFPQQDDVLKIIAQTARLFGLPSEISVADAAAFQYVITAMVPSPSMTEPDSKTPSRLI